MDLGAPIDWLTIRTGRRYTIQIDNGDIRLAVRLFRLKSTQCRTNVPSYACLLTWSLYPGQMNPHRIEISPFLLFNLHFIIPLCNRFATIRSVWSSTEFIHGPGSASSSQFRDEVELLQPGSNSVILIVSSVSSYLSCRLFLSLVTITWLSRTARDLCRPKLGLNMPNEDPTHYCGTGNKKKTDVGTEKDRCERVGMSSRCSYHNVGTGAQPSTRPKHGAGMAARIYPRPANHRIGKVWTDETATQNRLPF
ncbi:hypothetical protein ACRALDRAFT_210612 [Sodiomyces alcalophilus JCM 7366]|uniref:uncharacterized protein n=1 Tax=Sodiomyces alcalophilus JCM 7366 TaxID=591952 RepID=UPI0039B4A230